MRVCFWQQCERFFFLNNKSFETRYINTENQRVLSYGHKFNNEKIKQEKGIKLKSFKYIYHRQNASHNFTLQL